MVYESEAYLDKQWVCVIVDCARVVQFTIIPQDLANRGILLCKCKHLPRFTAFCDQFPVNKHSFFTYLHCIYLHYVWGKQLWENQRTETSHSPRKWLDNCSFINTMGHSWVACCTWKCCSTTIACFSCRKKMDQKNPYEPMPLCTLAIWKKQSRVGFWLYFSCFNVCLNSQFPTFVTTVCVSVKMCVVFCT